MVGTVIAGKYRIDSLLGSGGMANVYKAYDEQEGRVVAIKMLKEENREDAEFLRRFEREAKAVITLSHPNIVQSYDVGIDEKGVSFIVLEYVSGQTLKEHIKQEGQLSPKETVAIASKVLDALEHAHETGIIHRDVKPQNVIISDAGEVKLTDFGIARDATSTTRTFAGTNVIGSAHYISPEQAKGEDVTAESDIYSCAIMIYEMLTGTVPFAGENTVAIALKHIQEEMIPPIVLNPKIPAALSDVVVKGAAKDPKQRYSSAAEMKKDLQRALREPHGRFARLNKPNNELKKRRGSETIVAISVAIFGAAALFALVSMFTGLFSRAEDSGFLVPSVVGKTLEEARSLSELRGFKLEVADYVISSEYPSGQVTKQTPANGAKGREGDVIKVEVSSGSGYAIVPDLTGKTIQEASLMLSEENLNVGNVGYDPSSELPQGQIVRQEPAVDTRISEFEAVDIWISGSETQQIQMPSFVGKDIDTAKKMLSSSGFEKVWVHTVVPEEGETAETIRQQSPAADMTAGKSTLVELWLVRSSAGNYFADIAINLDIPEKERLVTVTAVMNDGIEMVIYEGKVKKGIQQPVAFTGALRYGGEYDCAVYVDGVEVRSIQANFTLK